jgi:hypothetical protein
MAILTTKAILTQSLTQQTDYPQACYRAAFDDRLFSTWRTSYACKTIIENVSYEQGLAFEKVIKTKFPMFMSFFEKLCLEDKVGSPVSYHYSVGQCSPVMLRYVKIAGDLRERFGDLQKLHVVEIGGGFGGQCKIVHDLGGFASYTLIDLPECTHLTRRYLKQFNIPNTRVVSCKEVKKQKFDLLISNYAIAEIDRSEQLEYINSLVNLAERGYMIYSHGWSHSMVKPFTLKELVSYLSIPNRTIKVEAEDPLTAENNVLITWRQND